MRDINGRHIWPELGLWIFGFLMVPLSIAALYGLVMIWIGLAYLFGNPDWSTALIFPAIVIGYLLLCIPGMFLDKGEP